MTPFYCQFYEWNYKSDFNYYDVILIRYLWNFNFMFYGSKGARESSDTKAPLPMMTFFLTLRASIAPTALLADFLGWQLLLTIR